MERVFDFLNKSAFSLLSGSLNEYLDVHHEEKDFFIFSDYCLDSKGIFNNVLTFTIAPHWVLSSKTVTEYISNDIKTDIKNVSKISDSTIKAINNSAFYHFSCIISGTNGVLYSGDKKIQQVAIENINSAIEMISLWIEAQPEGASKFSEQISRFKKVREHLKKKSANLKLFKWVIITTTLVSLFSFFISKIKPIKTIVWYSDRDNITTSFDNIYLDLFDINHFSMCNYGGIIENSIPKIGFGSDIENGRKIWFDPLIRIPDHISGSVAFWDRTGGKLLSEKHSDVLTSVFNSKFFNLFEFCFEKNYIEVSRILDMKSGKITYRDSFDPSA